MRIHTAAIAATVFVALIVNTAHGQLASRCVENSPERRGEVGCTIVEIKALPDGLKHQERRGLRLL